MADIIFIWSVITPLKLTCYCHKTAPWQRHTYHSSGEWGPRDKLQEMDNKNPYLPCFNIFIIAKQCAFHYLFELILQTYHTCQLAASLQLPGRTLVKVTLSNGWIGDVAVARGRYSNVPNEAMYYLWAQWIVYGFMGVVFEADGCEGKFRGLKWRFYCCT